MREGHIDIIFLISSSLDFSFPLKESSFEVNISWTFLWSLPWLLPGHPLVKGRLSLYLASWWFLHWGREDIYNNSLTSQVGLTYWFPQDIFHCRSKKGPAHGRTESCDDCRGAWVRSAQSGLRGIGIILSSSAPSFLLSFSPNLFYFTIKPSLSFYFPSFFPLLFFSLSCSHSCQCVPCIRCCAGLLGNRNSINKLLWFHYWGCEGGKKSWEEERWASLIHRQRTGPWLLIGILVLPFMGWVTWGLISLSLRFLFNKKG